MVSFMTILEAHFDELDKKKQDIAVKDTFDKVEAKSSSSKLDFYSDTDTAMPNSRVLSSSASDDDDAVLPSTELLAANTMSLALRALTPPVVPGPVMPAWMPAPWPQRSEADWTTLILRNVPCNYVRQDVLNLLDEHNVCYDFFYLPTDFRKRGNLGYAFVNVLSPMEAERVKQGVEVGGLDGFSDWKRGESRKRLEVSWAVSKQQGLLANIVRYRDSSVMHHDVPDEWKPVIFSNGQPQIFPPPAMRLKPPRGLKTRGLAK